ncbi:Sel1-like [Abeliophyllum distichum]|uniref:Sel1-like n=1 Tax=Abeliophyllum distichum TaxID=126358 RepID=A0ABD1VVJ1_9LAMI
MGKSPRLVKGRRESKNESSEKKRKRPMMEEEDSSGGEAEKQRGLPLSEVVSDCIKRWFADTLKEAKSGDINMQVLVGQMYYSGYGVPRDVQKGKIWITKASRVRSSVWKVSNKRPGDLLLLCVCACSRLIKLKCLAIQLEGSLNRVPVFVL